MMNIIKYINQIRLEKKLPLTELVSGICSRSQFYRYCNGEVDTTPPEILTKLLERLNISPVLFVSMYYSNYHSDIEYQMIKDQLENLSKQNYDEVNSYLQKVNVDELSNELNINYYIFLKTMLNYRTNNEELGRTSYILKKLANYPDCIKNDFLSIFEVNVISSFLQINLGNTDEILRDALTLYDKCLSFEPTTEGRYHDVDILSTNLTQVLLYYGEYEKAIKLAEKTISSVVSRLELTALTNLHYFKTLAQKNIGDMKYKASANTTLTLVEVEGNPSRIEFINNDFEEEGISK